MIAMIIRIIAIYNPVSIDGCSEKVLSGENNTFRVTDYIKINWAFAVKTEACFRRKYIHNGMITVIIVKTLLMIVKEIIIR